MIPNVTIKRQSRSGVYGRKTKYSASTSNQVEANRKNSSAGNKNVKKECVMGETGRERERKEEDLSDRNCFSEVA